MKCHFCEKTPQTLNQIVVPKLDDVDTSAFEYQYACDDCVKERGLEKKVIQTKKVG